MKMFILSVAMLISLFIAGCGSEVTLVVPVGQHSSPSISTNTQSQDMVNYYVSGTIDFYAPDYDVDTIEITVLNSRGAVVENTSTNLGAYAGKVSGSISFTIDYINYRPDFYTYSVSVTDKAGYISNPVYGSFRV